MSDIRLSTSGAAARTIVMEDLRFQPGSFGELQKYISEKRAAHRPASELWAVDFFTVIQQKAVPFIPKIAAMLPDDPFGRPRLAKLHADERAVCISLDGWIGFQVEHHSFSLGLGKTWKTIGPKWVNCFAQGQDRLSPHMGPQAKTIW